jgi:hypothetical protein
MMLETSTCDKCDREIPRGAHCVCSAKDRAIPVGPALGFFGSLFKWLTKPNRIDVYIHLPESVSNLKVDVHVPQVNLNVPTVHVVSAGSEAQQGRETVGRGPAVQASGSGSAAYNSSADAEAQKLAELTSKLGKLGTSKVPFGQESSS